MSDDSDDDLLTTPVFRSSNRRRTLSQRKSENAIDELIKSSKKDFDEAKRIQQLQVENNLAEKAFEKIQEEQASSAVKRKIEAIQSGFFEVEESEKLDKEERRRRSVMLENMKGAYGKFESSLVFKPDPAAKSKFYFSLEQCTEDLRSILSETDDPKLKKSLTSALEDRQLKHVLHILKSSNVQIPTALSAWMFRVALSEGIGDVHSLGSGAYNALMSLMQQEAADLSDSIFQMDVKHILSSWDKGADGAEMSCNKAGLANLLRIVSRISSRMKDFDASGIQEKLIDLCSSLTKSHGYLDRNILNAAEELQVILSARVFDEEDIPQLARRIMKDPQFVQDPSEYYPSVAKLVPFFREGEMIDNAACSMNAHLAMQALRHLLEGGHVFDDLLEQAFKVMDEVDQVDIVEKPLHMKALFSSYAAMQALKSNLEVLNSSKEADSKRLFAVGQAAFTAFIAGILLLGLRAKEQEGGKEYGTKEAMGSVFSLCDKLSTPLDFLTVYSNKYSADEHFRRLNCWLMVFDFYRLETLKKLKPKFDDGTLIQKDLTSFFTKIAL